MVTKLNNWLFSHKVIAGLLLFLLSLTFFAWLDGAPTFMDPDSFYHTKLSQMMLQSGWVKDFPYLQFTILKDGYIDHHLLYHIYLAPFTIIAPAAFGAKLGQIILVGITFLAFYWLLLKLRVRMAFWYVLSLFLVEPFIYRLALVKAPPFSLLLLFLAFYLIINRRYLWLAVLSFIYVWSYNAWFFVLLMAGLFVVVESLNFSNNTNYIKGNNLWPGICSFLIDFARTCLNRSNIKLLTSVIIGLALGIVINPYFPGNLQFYYIHIVKIGLVNYQSVINVGQEWYPFSAKALFTRCAFPLALGFLALMFFYHYRHKFDKVVKYSLSLFIIFLLATLRSRRNLEYFTPMAIIFGALVFSRLQLIDQARDDFQEFKKNCKKFFSGKPFIKMLLIFFLVLSAGALFYRSCQVKQVFNKGYSFTYLQPASNYLLINSQPGDIVFHTHWNEFPALFFHNSQNYYINGLDPTFMYLYDQELYDKWLQVSRGQNQEQLYQIISGDFRAQYVLVTIDRLELIENLNQDYHFEKIYSDSEAVIYKVL